MPLPKEVTCTLRSWTDVGVKGSSVTRWRCDLGSYLMLVGLSYFIYKNEIDGKKKASTH